MEGKLSTHVLDNYHGKPAGGVAWTLAMSTETGWEQISQGTTNNDGRTDAPLLTGEALQTARYRLTFRIDNYYRAAGVKIEEPPFLDEISIEVNLKSGQSYHVPLLMTPWSYATYRGS